MKQICMAGITVQLDFDDTLLHSNFKEFFLEDNTKKADIIITTKCSSPLTETTYGEQLIQAPGMCVYKKEADYILSYPHYTTIAYTEIFPNRHSATIYLSDIQQNVSSRQEEVFFAIRDIFFFYLSEYNCVAIHSASILYNEKGYIFSGHSGMGKSTHTNLWAKELSVPILNGDVIICQYTKENILLHGIPWCGTSQIYQNITVPLGGVFFLEKGKENIVLPLDFFESILRFSTRCFSPTWTEHFSNRLLDLAQDIISLVPCNILSCRPDKYAVYTVKHFIDNM